MGRKRGFNFSPKTKREVFQRQHNLCGTCGESLIDQEDFAHHIFPDQTGDPNKAIDGWLRSVDNCVYVCGPCHDMAHDENTVTGATAPPGWFKYSHGPDTVAHDAWVKRVADSDYVKSITPSQSGNETFRIPREEIPSVVVTLPRPLALETSQSAWREGLRSFASNADNVAFLGVALGAVMTWVADKGVARQIHEQLNSPQLQKELAAIRERGEGALVVADVGYLRWNTEGPQIPQLLSVLVIGATTPEQALQRWRSEDKLQDANFDHEERYGWLTFEK